MCRTKPARILFVEDEQSLVQVAQAQLVRRGYDVIVACQAPEALQALREAKNIDLLVTDLHIPCGDLVVGHEETGGTGLPGLVVAREFRRKFRRAPIVVWSKDERYEVIEQIRGIGHARFLCKRAGDIIGFIEAMLSGFRSTEWPRVFIVHGHDDESIRDLNRYVMSDLGFPKPTILKHEPSINHTVIEKLERYVNRLDLVFVLLTPDDEHIQEDGTRVWRARQNVVFELGYFIGALGRNTGRVIILYRGPVELPSDIAGIICIDISNGLKASSTEICRELQEWL